MAISEDPRNPGFDARAAVVNRTHRVIRQRANAMRERKRTTRDLIVPFVVCSALLLFIAAAVLHVTDESISDIAGIWKRIVDLGADAGSEVSLLLLWFLPLSVITAAVVLLRRNRRPSDRNDKVR
ncbi:hypothetical protein [Terriglobus sp. ADX1]|uniref:hypothetical protein n=1 Tax=Terriglobus sp. ADX1 TaxID=2794063 RepID=UPI002FE5CE66